MGKFKVGDIIVANEKSNTKYGMTSKINNWKGIVKEIIGGDAIQVTTIRSGKKDMGKTYIVDPYYFDLAMDIRDDIMETNIARLKSRNHSWNGFEIEKIIFDEVFIRNNYKIKGIYPNEKKKLVVVKFDDDSVIKVKCSKEDEFDVYVGVALAYSYKQYGSNTKFRKMVDKLIGGTKNGK